MAECTFCPKTSKKPLVPGDASVRHNTASVLREDALLKQKQAKEKGLSTARHTLRFTAHMIA